MLRWHRYREVGRTRQRELEHRRRGHDHGLHIRVVVILVRRFVAGRAHLRVFFVFFWDRGVEVFIFVLGIGFLVGVEVRLDVVEYDVSLSNGCVSRTSAWAEGEELTWVMRVLVALCALLMLEKKNPTSSSADRIRFGLNTVASESAVI